MAKKYKTYVEALKNRKNNELTIFDLKSNMYINIEVYPRNIKKTPWFLI